MVRFRQTLLGIVASAGLAYWATLEGYLTDEQARNLMLAVIAVALGVPEINSRISRFYRRSWYLGGAVLLIVSAGLAGAISLETSLLLLAAASALALYALLSGWILVEVLWRVALAILPLVALAAFVILKLILPEMERLAVRAGQDDVLRGATNALIAGTVLATGWLASSVSSDFQKERERDRTRIDTLEALRDEIFTVVELFDATAQRKQGDLVQQKMRTSERCARPYNPVPSRPSKPTIFNALSSSIGMIEAETLQPIARFYSAYSELDSFIEDFRSEPFSSLPIERRVKAHEALTKRRVAVLFWAVAATEAINRSLGVRGAIPRSGLNPEITGKLPV